MLTRSMKRHSEIINDGAYRGTLPWFAIATLVVSVLSVYPLDYRAAADCTTRDDPGVAIEVVSLAIGAAAVVLGLAWLLRGRGHLAPRLAVFVVAAALAPLKLWLLFVAAPGFC